MEIRGRHRGLPYALDRAILLPSASLLMRKDPSTLGRLRSRPSADDRNDPANVHDAPAAAIIDENVDVGHTKTRGLAGLLQRTFAAGPSHRLKAS